MPDPAPQSDGLSEDEARRRLFDDGPNELPRSRPCGMLRLLRDIVLEPMLLLLIACGAVYLVLGERGAALMLLGFVFVVIATTFFQQRRRPALRRCRPSRSTSARRVDRSRNASSERSVRGAENTPIENETGATVKRIAAGGMALVAVLALAWWAPRGDWLGGILAGLTLAMAMAILPEELPVVLTLFLGLGAWRLARACAGAFESGDRTARRNAVLCVVKVATRAHHYIESYII